MLPAPGLLSMVAGDFAEVYSRADAAESFDAVVTCFFLDTAHNVIEYMEVIRHVLKVSTALYPHAPPKTLVQKLMALARLCIHCNIQYCTAKQQLLQANLQLRGKQDAAASAVGLVSWLEAMHHIRGLTKHHCIMLVHCWALIHVLPEEVSAFGWRVCTSKMLLHLSLGCSFSNQKACCMAWPEGTGSCAPVWTVKHTSSHHNARLPWTCFRKCPAAA